ncbi:hypothetical protein DSO57_1030401 [Entomophthora muscae]|uniref:Uncharacterized protein n=1 Tax=Entomophthora muscae TaxID=34485 RepID=A0ACC2S314_9FUNG|nr:hypothetical protein DSO57_1030401 [Entomophthora muscae]
MEPPITAKTMPASSHNLPTNHTGKLSEIVYITLTGVIDTIIPAAGLWSWVGKSFSYFFKLAPLLWWTLPTKTLAQVTPENNRLAVQDWIPDTKRLSHQQETEWDTFLPAATFAYNIGYHQATRKPPFQLLYGKQPGLPLLLYLLVNPSLAVSQDTYLNKLVQMLIQL